MMDSNRRSYRGPAALVSEAKSFIAWILALLIVALAAKTAAKLVAGQTSHLTSHLPLTSNCDPFIGADGGGHAATRHVGLRFAATDNRIQPNTCLRHRRRQQVRQFPHYT